MHKNWLCIGKMVLLIALILSTMACGLIEAIKMDDKRTPQAQATVDLQQLTQVVEPTDEIPPLWTDTPPPPQVAPTEEPIAKSSAEEEIFTITSVGVAENGASQPTVFTIKESWLVTEIKTYHWNNGKGLTPGTIGLKSSDGTVYGPWQSTGAPGQGGVADAYWIVKPQVTIPAGTYTVIDSDPSTWAKNDADTGGMGMVWGKGVRMGNP
jgi:hypothetical protein